MSYKTFVNKCYDWVLEHPVLSFSIIIVLLFAITAILPERTHPKRQTSSIVPDYFDSEVINTIRSGGEINISTCNDSYEVCKEVFKMGHQMITEEYKKSPEVRTVPAKVSGDITSVFAFWYLTFENGSQYDLAISFSFVDEPEPTKGWVHLHMAPAK